MSLLDPRVWIAAMLAFGAAFGAGYFKGDRNGRKAEQLVHAAAVAAADEDARRLERARQSRADQAASLRAGREAGIRAAVDRVGRERDGLRDALGTASKRGAQSLDACRQHTATLEAVFGECRGQLEALGRDADGHASDSLMLQQAWPQ